LPVRLGVGKSTVAAALAIRANMMELDFDMLGIRDMEQPNAHESPFSATKLNLRQSLPQIVSSTSTGFVLHFGGETIFRNRVDNNQRLKQIVWLKQSYSARIVVLTATKDVLLGRFVSTRSGRDDDFERTWVDWLSVSCPRWRQCSDLFIDTSSLAVDDVIRQIETGLSGTIAST
jgi:shikimate kinase